ncbi:hypothetical protein CFP56_018758 [Quercus suber]|uniref:Uncharacterized protein n=1 Tax=Quercus suber TaxID=58331 RepID=A0AAW0KJ30_QUESU
MCFGISSIGQDWALRELVIKSLDQLKTGKGPATVKTIAGTMSVILLLSLMSIVKIQNKGTKLGTMSPMDQAFRVFCRREGDMKKTEVVAPSTLFQAFNVIGKVREMGRG